MITFGKTNDYEDAVFQNKLFVKNVHKKEDKDKIFLIKIPLSQSMGRKIRLVVCEKTPVLGSRESPQILAVHQGFLFEAWESESSIEIIKYTITGPKIIEEGNKNLPSVRNHLWYKNIIIANERDSKPLYSFCIVSFNANREEFEECVDILVFSLKRQIQEMGVSVSPVTLSIHECVHRNNLIEEGRTK